MATLLENLTDQLGSNELSQLTQLLGADEKHTQAAVPAGIATLLGGLASNASERDGAGALHQALERDHDGGVLDDLTSFLGGSAQTGIGEKILGHVLGGDRRTVENRLSESTGLDAQAVGRLLAALAPLVLAQLGRAQRQQNLDADGLSGLLDQERRQLRRQPPSSLGALSSLLDRDGDGEVMDDLVKSGGGLLGRLLRRR